MITKTVIWTVFLISLHVKVVEGACDGPAEDLKNGTWVSYERRLLSCLLKDYNPDVRPVANFSQVVHVTVELKLADIIKLDVMEQALHVNAWLVKQWVDFQLTWDPDKFGDVTEIRIAKDKIWIPDVILLNNAALDGEYVTDRLVVVTSRGEVTWMPHARLSAQCTPNMHRFPFDTQNCRIMFGSYTYDKKLMDIHLATNETKYYAFDSGEWEITNYKAEKTVWKQLKTFSKGQSNDRRVKFIDYPFLQYTLSMRRTSVFYGSLLVSPVVMLVILTNFIFLVPVESNERITLGIGILISLSLVATIIDDYLPSDLDSMPIIFVYLLFDFVMTTFAILISMAAMRCTYRDSNRSKVPNIVKDLVLNRLRRVVCIKAEPYSALPNETYGHNALPLGREMSATDPDDELPKSSSQASDKVLEDIRKYLKQLTSQQEEQEASPSHRQLVVSEWHQVAAVIDRFMFIIYIILSVVVTVAVLSH